MQRAAARALPTLPANAAYILINNPARRNALSLATLGHLRDQLRRALTPAGASSPLLLPPFRPQHLEALEAAAASTSSDDWSWLVDPAAWRAARAGLPDVLVLRASVPGAAVFSSGHDLRELSSTALGPDGVRETFAVCAEVMAALRRSPVPVVCAVEGLATAAGMQLALSADLIIARGRRQQQQHEEDEDEAAAAARFQLPGARLGLPCTSPATAVSRRLGRPLALRMLLTAEPVAAEDLPPGAVEVVAADGGAGAFEARVAEAVEALAGAAAQPAALAKWAFWTQAGIGGDGGGGGDGYEEAARWAGRVMALHATSADAREGMAAFLEKRKPRWVS